MKLIGLIWLLTLISCLWDQLLIKYAFSDMNYKKRSKLMTFRYISFQNQTSFKNSKKESTIPSTSNLRNLSLKTNQNLLMAVFQPKIGYVTIALKWTPVRKILCFAVNVEHSSILSYILQQCKEKKYLQKIWN